MSKSNDVTGLMSVSEAASALAESVGSVTGAKFAALDDIERAYRDRIVEAICDGSLKAFMPDTRLPVRRDTPFTAGFAVISLLAPQAVDAWLAHIGSPMSLGSADPKSDFSPARDAESTEGNGDPPAESFPTTDQLSKVLGPYWKTQRGTRDSGVSSLDNTLSSCSQKEGGKARSAYLLPSKMLRPDGTVGWNPVRVLVDARAIGRIPDPLGAADAIAREFPAFKAHALAATRTWAPSFDDREHRLTNYAFGNTTAVEPGEDCG